MPESGAGGRCSIRQRDTAQQKQQTRGFRLQQSGQEHVAPSKPHAVTSQCMQHQADVAHLVAIARKRA